MWKNMTIYFGDQLAIFPFSVKIPSKIVNYVFLSKMPNFMISSVFSPKLFCSVLTDLWHSSNSSSHNTQCKWHPTDTHVIQVCDSQATLHHTTHSANDTQQTLTSSRSVTLTQHFIPQHTVQMTPDRHSRHPGLWHSRNTSSHNTQCKW